MTTLAHTRGSDEPATVDPSPEGAGDGPLITSDSITTSVSLGAEAHAGQGTHRGPERSESDHADGPGLERPDELSALRDRLTVAQQLVALQGHPALLEALSEQERTEDRRVAEKLRAGQRAERLKAGKEQLRGLRRARSDSRWSQRATRARERLVNPDRRLAATYRRFVLLQAADLSLVVAGVVWMSVTVHDGLVGVDGPWVAYLVEPLASVLLIVSMLAQLTAVEHGRRVSRWFVALDVSLAGASLLLNVVPWGLRYGFSAGDLVAHILPPLLVVAAVIVYHMLNNLFGDIFADAHVELQDSLRLSDETADVLALVERTRRAIADGHIGLGEDGIPVVTQIARRFAIGKQRAQLTADAFRIINAARAAARTDAPTTTPEGPAA